MAALGNYAAVGFEGERGALDVLMDDGQALALPHQPINQLPSTRLCCDSPVRSKPWTWLAKHRLILAQAGVVLSVLRHTERGVC